VEADPYSKRSVAIEAFPPPTPDQIPVPRPTQSTNAAPTWTPPKTSSGVGRRILIGIGSILVFGAIRDFLTPSERTKVEDSWSALTAPERAMLCWGREGAEESGGQGIEGVTREVLNAKCPAGETQTIAAHAPLGEETERKWLDETKSEYEDSPAKPEELGITDADVPTFCGLSAERLVKNVDPDFFAMPWEGTDYEPSHEFEVQMTQLTLDSLCG